MSINDAAKKAVIDAFKAQIEPLEEALRKAREERNVVYKTLGITSTDILRLTSSEERASKAISYWSASSRSGESDGHEVIYWTDRTVTCNCPAGQHGRLCWAAKIVKDAVVSQRMVSGGIERVWHPSEKFGHITTGFKGMSRVGFLTGDDQGFPPKVSVDG